MAFLGAISAVAFCSSCATNQRPVSDHFDGKRFFYPNGPALHSCRDNVRLAMEMTDQQGFPKWVENHPRLDLKSGADGDIKITFVNHSTVLIQMGPYNILTDPVWSER